MSSNTIGFGAEMSEKMLDLFSLLPLIWSPVELILHSQIVISDRKETKTVIETVGIKEELNASSNVPALEERKGHEAHKATVLPQALLKEVTSMVKQQVVTVPSSKLDQGEKLCITEAVETDKPAISSWSEEKVITSTPHCKRLEDTGIYPDKLSPKKEDMPEETVEEVPEGSDDPFSGLDVDVEVVNKQIAVDETDILPDLAALFSGELEKRRKRELKKAKQMSWKKKDKRWKEENESNKPARPSINYFVGIQISNPKIQAALKKVQDSVASVCEELKPALNRPATLHLTMFVLSINTEEDMLRARQALDIAQKRLEPLYTESPLLLDIAGLGNFRHEVVFAKIKPEAQVSQLQHIAETLEECFLEQEIVSPDKKGFKPHITVMKMSFLKGRKRKGLRKIDVKLYEDYTEAEFGRQEVDTLQLCSIHKKKDSSGYYQLDHKVKFAASVQTNESQDFLPLGVMEKVKNTPDIDNTGKETDMISVQKAECAPDRTDEGDIISDIEPENNTEMVNKADNKLHTVPNVKESTVEHCEIGSNVASETDNGEDIVIDSNVMSAVKKGETLV